MTALNTVAAEGNPWRVAEQLRRIRSIVAVDSH